MKIVQPSLVGLMLDRLGVLSGHTWRVGRNIPGLVG